MKPGVECMDQLSWSPLVQTKAYRLLGAKPLPTWEMTVARFILNIIFLILIRFIEIENAFLLTDSWQFVIFVFLWILLLSYYICCGFFYYHTIYIYIWDQVMD